jgi:cytochrome c-type biogenesis protein CcmE
MSDAPAPPDPLPAPDPSRRARTRGFVIASIAAAVIALVVLAVGGIGENLVYYWGPTDLREAGNKAVGATIRLGGQVGEGSIVFGEGVSSLEFDVVDGRNAVHVKATGVPPQMFRDGIGVVVEGTMTKAGHFQGNRLMVSHDNEYRAPGDPKAVDVKKLMRSTQGLDEKGEGAAKAKP